MPPARNSKKTVRQAFFTAWGTVVSGLYCRPANASIPLSGATGTSVSLLPDGVKHPGFLPIGIANNYQFLYEPLSIWQNATNGVRHASQQGSLRNSSHPYGHGESPHGGPGHNPCPVPAGWHAPFGRGVWQAPYPKPCKLRLLRRRLVLLWQVVEYAGTH